MFSINTTEGELYLYSRQVEVETQPICLPSGREGNHYLKTMSKEEHHAAGEEKKGGERSRQNHPTKPLYKKPQGKGRIPQEDRKNRFHL